MPGATGLSPINAMILKLSLGMCSSKGEMSWKINFPKDELTSTRIVLVMNYHRDELSKGQVILGMSFPTGWNFLEDENLSKIGLTFPRMSLFRDEFSANQKNVVNMFHSKQWVTLC